jgi:ribose 1,5-bisphosphokinase
VKARLIYTVGLYGAGKDSLLEWLKRDANLPMALHIARRCITRKAQAEGEQHESVDLARFDRLVHEDAFGLYWHANDLHDGVRHEELSPLREERFVVVNGSREYLPTALSRFPNLVLLHITATKETLRARLHARGRETPEAIARRVDRAKFFAIPATVPSIEICNDGALEAAGRLLCEELRKHLAATSLLPERSARGRG